MRDKKKGFILLLTIIAMVTFFLPNALLAQDVGPRSVTGNTYSCFFFTPIDIFSSDIQFKETGGLSMTSFAGNGFYLSLTDFFIGFYWALDASIGEETADIIMVMTGMTLDPFIIGAGVIVVQYSQLAPFTFSGFELVEQTSKEQ